MAHGILRGARFRETPGGPAPPGQVPPEEVMFMRKLAIFALLAAAAAALLKRQRDREFDESIWEEPREV